MVIINKNFSPEDNFWELNPQLCYMKPFSELYNSDSSKNKKSSSNDMWTIFFISDPDEEKNIFFRIPEEERISMLKEEYNISFDKENPIIKKCLDAYPEVILDSVERSLKDMKDLLTKRSKTLLSMQYTLETMKAIDDALSKNLKIYDDFKKIEEAFKKSKKEMKAKGQRNLTLAEQGKL